MKLKLLSLLLILSVASVAAQDITSVFLSVPDSILFGIDAQGKDQLLSRANDTIEVEVRSRLNSQIKRTNLSDNFISLETSSAGTLQIKLLPLINDSKIVCVIRSVCGKACDSHIAFYATNWQPLENAASLVPALTLDAFIKPDADRQSEDFRNAQAALDMLAIKYDLNAGNDTLCAYLDLQNYLGKDDYNKIKPYLIEQPKIFGWDKVSFK
jgi:hypothetical protein